MIIGSKGIPVSYRSDRLIKELKRDIQECGENKIFVVWMKNLKKYGVEVAVNNLIYTNIECGIISL